jgi:hypothetical protein
MSSWHNATFAKCQCGKNAIMAKMPLGQKCLVGKPDPSTHGGIKGNCPYWWHVCSSWTDVSRVYVSRVKFAPQIYVCKLLIELIHSGKEELESIS